MKWILLVYRSNRRMAHYLSFFNTCISNWRWVYLLQGKIHCFVTILSDKLFVFSKEPFILGMEYCFLSMCRWFICFVICIHTIPLFCRPSSCCCLCLSSAGRLAGGFLYCIFLSCVLGFTENLQNIIILGNGDVFDHCYQNNMYTV